MNTNNYKITLEKHRDDLKNQLSSLGVQDPHNPSDWVTAQTSEPEADSNNVADHTEDFIESRATLSVLETEFNAVVEALARIEDGSYGKCQVCGEAIPTERLEVLPEASTCTKHAT